MSMEQIQELFKQGRELMEAADYAQAAIAFRDILALNADHEPSLVALARIATLYRRFEEARQFADRALELRPGSLNAWAIKGMIEEASGHQGKAIDAYRQATTLSPNNATTWFQLGRSLGGTNEYDEAIKALNTAIQLEPGLVEAHYALGICYQMAEQPGAALQSFTRTIELNPAFLDGYLTVADLLTRQRKFAFARKVLEQAEGLFPREPMVLEKKAAVAICEDELEEATELLTRQLKLDPDNLTTYLNLSAIAQLQGKLQTALDVSERLIERNPLRWEGHYHRATVLDMTDKVDEAMAGYRKAASLAPESEKWRPLNNLAYLLNAEQREASYQEAETLLREALTLAPTEAQPLYNLALALAGQDKNDAAMKCCTQLLEMEGVPEEMKADAVRLRSALQEG